MPFFKKTRRDEPNRNDVNPIEVRDRIQAIRNRVGHTEIKLGDLFALIGEHERARPPEPLTESEIVLSVVSEPPRVNPDDIPTREPKLKHQFYNPLY